MKKRSFLSLLLCLCLTGCGSGLGSRPTAVSAGAPSSSLPDAVYKAEQRALSDSASRTAQGVYYQQLPPPADPFDLAPNAITAAQAADLANGLAAGLGFPVGDLVWQVSAVSRAADGPIIAHSCLALLPPATDHTVDYATAAFEELYGGRESAPAIEINFGEQGQVLSYFCHQQSSFEREDHTAEELQAHLQKEQEWLGSQEFQQIVSDGAAVLAPSPVSLFLPPDETDGSWRVRLGNGDVYRVEASLGVGTLESFALLF